MAVTGDGKHPLISSWFVPRYNPPYKSLHKLRRSIGIESDLADTSIWQDFFFPAASTAISGTVATDQATQGLTASGTVPAQDITGTTTTAQTLQVISAAGTETFSGTVNIAQSVQVISAAGTETFSGTVAIAESAQALSSAGSENFSGTMLAAQLVQSEIASGQEDFSATAALSQAVQVGISDGQEQFSATGAIDQAIQESLGAGSISDPATPTPAVVDAREPRYIIGLPSEVRGRPRRGGQSNTGQDRQQLSAVGIVTEVIRGESGMVAGKQEMRIRGRKDTFARDLKAILEIVELEAA